MKHTRLKRRGAVRPHLFGTSLAPTESISSGLLGDALQTLASPRGFEPYAGEVLLPLVA